MKYTIVIKKISIILLLSTVLLSCKKFLDEKTNKKLVVPATLQDAQAMLDFYSLMNAAYSSIGSQSDDDFYLLDSYWNSASLLNQNNYVWARDTYNDADWGYMYQVVLNANLIKETADNVQPVASNINDWKSIEGGALFYRAYAFYQVAQYYAQPYDKGTAGQTAGIPLRLTSDVNEKSVRATLQETYDQIIHDYLQAALLLPVSNNPVSRPSKAAAYAGLARTYLTMEDYSLAGKYADSCLQLNNALMDYNTLTASATFPVPRFNAEVIFPSNVLGTGSINVSNWRVDSLLYQSYAANDLRRSIFFQSNGTGTFGFKGTYDGSTSRFNGIATDEIYLIRAECRARLADINGAMNDLNTLLIKRWKTGSFISITATNADDALMKILVERRKELVLRNIRWFDLRRLNKDARFAKTLIRKLNGQTYQLLANDPRYTEYIPQSVIDLSGIQQNVR